MCMGCKKKSLRGIESFLSANLLQSKQIYLASFSGIWALTVKQQRLLRAIKVCLIRLKLLHYASLTSYRVILNLDLAVWAWELEIAAVSKMHQMQLHKT